MANVQTKLMMPGDRMKARIKRVKDMVKVPGVRVVPAAGEGWTEDDMRRLLEHPSAGRFRPEGSIEWPNDTFTKRRLAEGSVKLAEGHEQGDEGQHHRRRSHQDDAA